MGFYPRNLTIFPIRVYPHCHPSGFARVAQIFRSRFDPCRLVRQVKEIGWLELSHSNSPRPLPVHPARELDFLALTVNGEVDCMCDVIAEESDSPATQGGRGLIGRGCLASSRQSSSPAARGGRGRPAAPITHMMRVPVSIFTTASQIHVCSRTGTN